MQLDVPLAGERHIRIGSHTWRLRFVDTLNADKWGECDPVAMTIEVALDAPESMQLSTLLHELMHAIEHTYECRIRHQDLNLIADMLAGVLIDNWRTQ